MAEDRRRPSTPPPVPDWEDVPVQAAGYAARIWLYLASGIAIVAVGGFGGWYIANANKNADPNAPRVRNPLSGCPVVAMQDLESSGGRRFETPAFEVDDDWIVSCDGSGVELYIFVVDINSGSETLLERSGVTRMLAGGRFKIIVQSGGPARVAVFQDRVIPLRDVPKNCWINMEH